MSDFFDFPVRVYYEDTDAGGVVFYANFLRFFERARTEWLRRQGISQHAMMEREQVMFVVRHTSVDYLRAARLDDLLSVRSRIHRLGRVAVTFAQEARRTSNQNDELLASSVIKVACVTRSTLRPAPIPASVRAALQPSHALHERHP